jgi:hypothetical protein
MRGVCRGHHLRLTSSLGVFKLQRKANAVGMTAVVSGGIPPALRTSAVGGCGMSGRRQPQFEDSKESNLLPAKQCVGPQTSPHHCTEPLASGRALMPALGGFQCALYACTCNMGGPSGADVRA